MDEMKPVFLHFKDFMMARIRTDMNQSACLIIDETHDDDQQLSVLVLQRNNSCFLIFVSHFSQ